MVSAKPRKQRKFRFNAPLHVRRKFVSAHISKELAEKMKIKARSIEVRRGDTVKVVSGGQKGKSGKVSKVDLKRGFVYIEGIVRKTSKGKEVMVPIRASNLYITDLDLGDKYRKELIDKMVSK
ncbi:MAG: 50S ribosomal protein L24 [Candidatus Micrarchaeia archaeon]|jgi:large subunit ribosomal protein L24